MVFSAFANFMGSVYVVEKRSKNSFLTTMVGAVATLVLTFVLIKTPLGVQGAALATVISQAISAILCFIYMKRRYPELKLSSDDFIPNSIITKSLISTGSSMAFMSAFVQFGTFTLQTSINTFGTNIIVAHSAARKLTSILMMPWLALGSALATFCGQNWGAKKYSRIKKGLRDTIFFCWAWCILVLIVTYTISPSLIQLVTASNESEILQTGALYLKVNTIFYFITAVICLSRNAMQGFGNNKTPVFSSSLELITKVIVAFVLAPAIGYWGIIISEPVAWIIMVIPLIVNLLRNPVLKQPDGV